MNSISESEAIPHLGIPNPTDEQFQRIVKNSALDNNPSNWRSYFEAAIRWTEERLGFVKIKQIEICQYWVTLILEECSAETEQRVRAILDNSEDNKFEIGFGRATEATMRHW